MRKKKLSEDNGLETARANACLSSIPKKRGKFQGKPGRSGPPGNENDFKHGLYSLMAQRRRGLPSGRTVFGREFKRRLKEYTEALGGEDVSPMKRTLIEDVVWLDYYIMAIDLALSGRRLSIAGKQGHSLLEIRPRLAAQRRENLKTLGLERKVKTPTLGDMRQELLNKRNGST